MSRAFSQAKLKGEERKAILQAIETQMQQVIIDRNGTRKGVIFHKYLALYQKYLAIPQISGGPVELPDLKVSWIVIVVSWTVFFRRDPTPRS